MISFTDHSKLEAFHDKLYTMLQEASQNGEFVQIQKGNEFRGIGKTTALIKFARDNNYSVIMSSSELANKLREHYGYGKIYGIKDVRGRSNQKFVIDQGVYLPHIMEAAIDVVTGYVS